MGTPRRVLLVEDDQDIRDAVAESLEQAGYGVSTAENGASAISSLEAAGELPHLILLDLMMPVMDGEHFLKEMKKNASWASVPVVLLTADGNAQAKAARLGVSNGLRKPIDVDALLEAVSAHARAP
jgi:DNA-binding response OmpR family regulator